MEESVRRVSLENGVELGMLTELLRGAQDMKVILTFGQRKGGAGQDREDLEERLTELFIRFGIRPKLKGYQYLRTALLLCAEDREELDGITKRLYPAVAKLHRTSPDRVEHAIRHAIEVSWETGRPEIQREVFGYDRREYRRPTNMEFIMQVMEYLQREPRCGPVRPAGTGKNGEIYFGC